MRAKLTTCISFGFVVVVAIRTKLGCAVSTKILHQFRGWKLEIDQKIGVNTRMFRAQLDLLLACKNSCTYCQFRIKIEEWTACTLSQLFSIVSNRRCIRIFFSFCYRWHWLASVKIARVALVIVGGGDIAGVALVARHRFFFVAVITSIYGIFQLNYKCMACTTNLSHAPHTHERSRSNTRIQKNNNHT